MAGDQHHRSGGRNCDQADQPEMERAVGQLIDLIADRDRQHLVR
jgi:hypothetical protein